MSGGLGGAALLPWLFSFSWVNARVALPCPKARVSTAKRRLQAQQKSAWRYSRNSKRRLKAQQKSACKHSRPEQRRVQVQQKAPGGAFLPSVGTAPTGADKNRMLPKRTWQTCPPGQEPRAVGRRRDGRGCGPRARILIEAPRSGDPTLDVSPSRIHLCHGATGHGATGVSKSEAGNGARASRVPRTLVSCRRAVVPWCPRIQSGGDPRPVPEQALYEDPCQARALPTGASVRRHGRPVLYGN